MRKFRILAVILAVLMLPMSLFVACNKNKGDGSEFCPDGSHKLGVRTVVSRRTCTTDELITRKCNNCPYVEEKRTPARGHTLEAYVSDNNATCTEDGTKSKRCACGYRETSDDAGSALGHTFIVYEYYNDFSEISTCIRCENAVNYRTHGIILDFEPEVADPSHAPSYDRYSVFADTAKEFKTEGEGETSNSYLSIKREEGVILGNSAYGLTLNPRPEVLKGESVETSPSYIVEFDIRISKEGTKDLVLLEGRKNGVPETFLTYDAQNGVINSNLGPVYDLKETDYGTWLKIGLCLNDGKMVYEVYINDVLVTASPDSVGTSISYKADGYFMGYDLESFKVAMTSGAEASSFDIDNVKIYIADQPKGFDGTVAAGYSVYKTASGEKLVYKNSAAGCECNFTDNILVVDETCTTAGYSIGTCTVCGGQKIFDEVAATGHTNEVVDVVDATCTVGAYTNYKCSVCDKKDIVYDPDNMKLGHKINENTWVVTPATCLRDGWTEGFCEREYCKIPMKPEELVVPALGHALLEMGADGNMKYGKDYEHFVRTCTTNEYSVGKCVRFGLDGCDKEYSEDDEVEFLEAYGHEIDTTTEDYFHIDATCTEDGYSTGRCVRYGTDSEDGTFNEDGCGHIFTEDSLVEAAFGHSPYSTIQVVDGENKVASTCVTCGNVELKDVYTAYPDSDTMVGLTSGMGVGSDNAIANQKKYNFENDTLNKVRGDLYGKTNVDSFSVAYSTITTKADILNPANKYGEWRYEPENNTGAGTTSYINFSTMGNGGNKDGAEEDFVFEFSLRKTKGEDIMPLDILFIERTTTSPNAITQFVVNAQGHIRGNGHVFGVVTEDKWTRVAFVLHANPGQDSSPSVDVYIDGELMYQDWLFKDFASTDQFPDFTDIRISTKMSSSSTTSSMDIDEVYVYYGDAPIYMTKSNGVNFTDMVFTDTSVNTGEVEAADGTKIPYIAQGALGGATILEGQFGSDGTTPLNSDDTVTVTLGAGANTIFAAENVGTEDAPEYAMHIQINPTLPSIAEATTGKSEISVTGKRIKYQRTFCFETDMKIAEGTSAFDILTGVRDGKTYAYLTYSEGKIYSGETEIMTVTYGEWFNIAVTLNEHTGVYTVFVNGAKVQENMNVSDDYKHVGSGLPGSISFKVFAAHETSETGTYDVYYKNTGLYGGHYLPNSYILAQIAASNEGEEA